MPGTRCINYRDLKRQVELNGAEPTVALLSEALEERELRPEDFSVRELAEAFVSREWVQSMNPRHNGTFNTFMEAAGNTTTGAFSNIISQITYNALLNAFQSEQFVFTPLVTNIPTEFNGERIAGIGGIGDDMEVIPEGQGYPLVSPNEDYIDTPPTRKRGAIVALTREAVFFDRTGRLLEEARRVGQFLGLNKEKRIIDAVIDENAGAVSAMLGGHRYHWKGTSYATFQGTTPWINTVANGGLVDWTDVEAIELLFADITDPSTGEPVLVIPKHLIVTPQLVHTARRIINATNIRVAAGGFPTSGNVYQTDGPNTLDSYQIVSSRLLKARLGTDTSHFLGDISQAVCYMENWPLQLSSMGAGSEDEFNRDIVAKFKASERGAAYVREPRALARGTVA